MRCSLLPFLHCGTRLTPLPQALRKYLNDEHLDKKKKPFDFTGWEDRIDKVRVVPFERWTPLLMTPTSEYATTGEWL